MSDRPPFTAWSDAANDASALDFDELLAGAEEHYADQDFTFEMAISGYMLIATILVIAFPEPVIAAALAAVRFMGFAA